MGVVNTTYTFSGTDTITSSKLNNIIDDTTFTSDAIQGNTLQVVSPGKLAVNAGGITSNELASGAVTQAKLASNVATTGPAFHVYASTNQSVPNSGAVQVVQFNTEVFDVGSCFNATNHRFTPNVAGYYQINLSLQIDYGGSGYLDRVFMALRKNGISGTYYDVGIFNSQSFLSSQFSGSVLVYMNGSNDYIEATAAITGTSTAAVVIGTSTRTYMSGFLARSA
jgi:hypothetical protein